MRDVFASMKARIRSEAFEEGFIVGRIADRLEQKAECLDIMSQCLISYLEQRFSALPASLKDRIRQVDDIKKMCGLLASAGTTPSPEAFARQLAC